MCVSYSCLNIPDLLIDSVSTSVLQAAGGLVQARSEIVLLGVMVLKVRNVRSKPSFGRIMCWGDTIE